jgi:hypothetical protein
MHTEYLWGNLLGDVHLEDDFKADQKRDKLKVKR